MTTTFVFDGNEIEVKNDLSNFTLFINGEKVDHAKGVFRLEKDTLSGKLDCSDGNSKEITVKLVHAEGVYKAKLYVGGTLIDVRYMF